MTMPMYRHDPNANLPYEWDWSSWLEGADTIVSHVITVPAGLTLGSHANTTTTVTAWISGGTAGKMYTVACRVTTDDGLVDERSIRLRCKER